MAWMTTLKNDQNYCYHFCGPVATFEMPCTHGISDDATLWANVEANICAFARCTKQTVPIVNEVTLLIPADSEVGTQMVDQGLVVVASHLPQLASRFTFCCYEPFTHIALLPDILHDLVYIKYFFDGHDISNIEQLMQVVRQSAPTLQHLTIGELLNVDVVSFIQDIDGRYVQYPCLLTLDLGLDLGMCNSATLEFLHVMPGIWICRVLSSYDVSTATSHPKLRCVKLELSSDSSISHFDEPEDYLQFALSIATDAAVRFIGGLSSGDWFSSGIDLLNDHTCVQVLVFPDSRLDLMTIIHLTMWLPLLSDLHIKAMELGNSAEEAARDDYPVYMRSLYNSASERFWCLRLGHKKGDDLKETAVCVLVLAMVYPNFDYATLPNYVHNEFMLTGALIFGHMKGFNHLSFDRLEDDFEERLTLLLPLLLVCRDFCDATFANYSEQCKIWSIADLESANIVWPTWPSCLREHVLPDVYPVNHLARKLQIVTDVQSIFSGSTLEILLHASFDGRPFPRAQSLVCAIKWQIRASGEPVQQVANVPYSPFSEADVLAFVQRVKQMAPMAGDISVPLSGIPTDLRPSFQNLLGSLAAQLYRSASRVRHLYNGCQSDAARNDPTLQHLDLKFNDIADMTGLIRDSGGNYCVRVEKLPGDIQDWFDSFEDYIQLVLSIALSATVWDIANIKAKEDTSFALGLLQTHASIHILPLPNSQFYLWDAIALIKSLPLLIDLRCLSVYASDFADDLTSFEAATQMCSLFNLEIEKFRTTYASYLNYPVRHLTREIQIRVYVNDIYDGPALQLLSADPCDGCAFPQARELTFYLVTECSYDDDDGRLPPDTDTNILAFVQRIKEMAPLVSKVYLCISDMDGYVVTSSSKNMRFLLSNLSKLTKTTLFANGCAQLMAYLDLAQICKLVHIDFQIKEDSTTRTAYRSDTPDY
ncbi:hypothetical protein GGI17_002546 [Coemansia sp. S146]|nr:hypothetical protein GGI17_002546 [Coemansia sp. S146]